MRVPAEVERKILELAGLLPASEPPDDPADEEEFMQRVIDLATELGYRHFHPRDSRKSVAGWPDLVLVKPGRLLFAELKSDMGRPTAAQEDWLDRLREAGQEVYLWRPSDCVSIEKILRG